MKNYVREKLFVLSFLVEKLEYFGQINIELSKNREQDK